jgi:dihydroorotase
VSVLLRGVRPYGEAPTDVLLRDGVIAEIGAGLSGDDVLDGDGLVLLPGLVDLHTHLREPGREDAETVQSGSAAAALGGYTAAFAMPNTDPAADTAGVVEQVWRLGREAGLVDVAEVGGGKQMASGHSLSPPITSRLRARSAPRSLALAAMLTRCRLPGRPCRSAAPHRFRQSRSA